VGADGKSLDGLAKLTVTRRDWNCVWEDWGYRGSYQCKDTTQTILAKTLQLAGGKPAEFEITAESGGDYWVVVEGMSDKDEAAPAAVQIYAWATAAARGAAATRCRSTSSRTRRSTRPATRRR